jgi:hypothetical protein
MQIHFLISIEYTNRRLFRQCAEVVQKHVALAFLQTRRSAGSLIVRNTIKYQSLAADSDAKAAILPRPDP